MQNPTQMLCALACHVLKRATELGVEIPPQAVQEVKQAFARPRSTEFRTEAFLALRNLLAGIEQPFALLLGKPGVAVLTSLSWLSGALHFG